MDRYHVYVLAHDIGSFYRIRAWCDEQFGYGWGESVVCLHDRHNNYHKFFFKRLNHAQWCILKFGQLT